MFTKIHLIQWRLMLIVAVSLGTGLGVAGLIGSAQAAAALDYRPAKQSADLVDGNLPGSRIASSESITYYAYLPVTSNGSCQSVYGTSYGSLAVPNWTPAERPAELHGDLNLALRGYVPTNAFLGLVDINGPTDPGAPQLKWLFDTPRAPIFVNVYRVNNWDWGCNCRGEPIEDWEVTLADLATAPGEIIRVPDRAGGDIGNGYKVLVLYADVTRLTLKYTSEDSVVQGYTIHLENICVAPGLLTLYRTLNIAGRHELPALPAKQALGRAMGDQVGVAIRDSGAFLDPRSRKDWWRDY